MADFIQDFRYCLRHARRSPGFFAIAALLIALGIAATTGIFTLVDALLLRPLPVRDPQNLVQVFQQQEKRPADPLFDYRFFSRLAQYSSTLFKAVGQMDAPRALEWDGRVERIHAVAVTENFFSDLGVEPLLGRVLAAKDNHVAVLSYACWSRSFSRDPKVLGQTVRLQGHSFTIVGVTSQAFTGTTVDSSPDLWMPFANQIDFSRTPDPNLDGYVVEIIARLRPGVSEARAQQETAALWTRYRQETEIASPENDHALKTGKLEVISIAHGVSPIRDHSKAALKLLLAGTGFLLLMVCANVGGLLLSRATACDQDTAVRLALGASRPRIVRQWLIESGFLTIVGGSAGVSIAYASLPALMYWMPPAHGIGFDPGEIRALTLHLAPDLRVTAFALALFGFTAIVCAMAPAWKSCRTDISSALKVTISDRRNSLFQAVLCGFQIALCTSLLVVAGLIVRSVANLRAVDAGFDREHVTVFSIDPHVRRYDSERNWLLQRRLLDEVRRLPGVQGSAIAYRGLMRGIGLGTSVVFPAQSGGVINTSVNSVTPEYFGVMGIRFLMGRNFNATDKAGEDKLREVIVNRAFVHKFLNDRQPIGEKFATGQRFTKPEYEIVGVVSDTKYRSLREVPPPIYYTCDFGPKAYPDAFILHVKSSGDPHAIIGPVRRLLRSIDPALPLFQIATLAEEVDQSLWQERLLMGLTTCFGAFALSLSAIGMYGILAYFTAGRQREIGLRMALGAHSRHVVGLVVRRIIPTLALGILMGAALSLLAGTAVTSLLYGIEPFDPLSETTAISLLLTVGIAGAALPAFRAISVEPASVLRQRS